MSSIKYVNLFIRGVPSSMEPQELAKVLSLYGEMNPRPCAYSIKFRYTYNQYMSKDENMRQPTVDNTRYNVVLYGFKVCTDISANMSMSFMFLNLIQMKRNIRHSWIDSEGQPQYVNISENNRPIPSNLLSQLLWSEDINHPNTTNLTPIKQTVTFVESKLPDKCGPNLIPEVDSLLLLRKSEEEFGPNLIPKVASLLRSEEEFEDKKQETPQEDNVVENNLNHAWIDAVEQRVWDTVDSEEELAELEALEEKRRIDDIMIKELRNDMIYQSTEHAKMSRWLLNSIMRKQNKQSSNASQSAEHDYLVNWARNKEQNLVPEPITWGPGYGIV